MVVKLTEIRSVLHVLRWRGSLNQFTWRTRHERFFIKRRLRKIIALFSATAQNLRFLSIQWAFSAAISRFWSSIVWCSLKMAACVVDGWPWRYAFLLFLSVGSVWIVFLLFRIRGSIIVIRRKRSFFLFVLLLIDNSDRSFINFLISSCCRLERLCLNCLLYCLTELIIIEA